MPIYNYYCEKCKINFEKLVFGNVNDFPCPNCYNRARKIPSFANFIVTGYNSKNNYSGEKNGRPTKNKK